MSSKELLIKELENLNALEISQLRSYVRQLKGKGRTKKKPATKAVKANMNALRKSLSKIKGSMADFISNEREDRL